jgi:hypothetical protein
MGIAVASHMLFPSTLVSLVPRAVGGTPLDYPSHYPYR